MRIYVTRECRNCGRHFQTTPTQVRHGRGLNCSRACAVACRGAWPDRFWSKVNKTDSCWLWIGAPDRKGYGVVQVPGRGLQRAHRIAWELVNGPILDGLFVCHDCPEGDNPRCVNPSHLWLGTNDQNMADMAAKGRANGGHLQGERNGFARLTDATVRAIRERYAAGGISQQALADEYGVVQTTISRAIRGDRWTHVA